MPNNLNWNAFHYGGQVPHGAPPVNNDQAQAVQQQVQPGAVHWVNAAVPAGNDYVHINYPQDYANPVPALEPPPAVVAAAAVDALGLNAANLNYEKYMADVMNNYGRLFNPGKKPKKDRSTSLWYDEFRALASLTTKLKGLINREQGELASVLETIATQVEVVRDIGSQVQSHISTLQKVAIQLETLMEKMPLTDSQRSEIEQAASRSAPAEVDQPVVVEVQPVEPELWPPDQG